MLSVCREVGRKTGNGSVTGYKPGSQLAFAARRRLVVASRAMETLKALQLEAIRALRDVLRDPEAKPDVRLRAAEALLRAEPDTVPSGQGATLDATDDELLAAARGVHPREKGPAVPAAETVPSDARTDHATALREAAERDSRLEGTQRGPAISNPGGGTQRGPAKCDPPGLALPKRGKLKPKVDRQISVDNTPRVPDPWE
jgi:hypothetical protein